MAILSTREESPTLARLEIEVPAEEVGKALSAVTRAYAKRAAIPGFRKGHAPESVIQKRFAGEIREDVLEALLPDALSSAVKEKGLSVLGHPRIEELKWDPPGPIRFTARLDLKPAVEPGEWRGIPVEDVSVELVPVRPFGLSPKGRASLFICTDQIRIAPGRCAVTSVELGTHLIRRRDPHVVGEECVDGAPQHGRGPLLRHSHTDRLPARVDARVGTAGSLSHYTLSAKTGEHSLDFALNGPLLGLDLPAGKGGPVIVQHELHSARRHASEISVAQ